MDSRPGTSKWAKAQAHNQDFVYSFKARVIEGQVPDHIFSISRLPNIVAIRYIGYCINGYKFYTRERDSKCTTQNSEVSLTAVTPSFACSKDKNPTIANVEYYGAMEEIIEIDYWGAFSFVLFRCVWFDAIKDDYGLTCVNFSKLCYTNDPFVLASQVHQIFHIQDPLKGERHYVLQNVPRDLLEECMETNENQYWAEASNGVMQMAPYIGDDDGVSWFRPNVDNENLEVPFDVNDQDRVEVEDDSE